MTAPIYLYSYGRNRHIANPDEEPDRQGAWARAYCGGWHQTEAGLWSEEPVCKTCQRLHDKRVAT